MTETRTATRQPNQQSSAEEEIAGAIALLLAGSVAPPSGVTLAAAIAALLARLPDLPETDEIGAVSRSVSRLVVRDRPILRGDSRGSVLRAHTDNISYRAHYAIQAMRRVAENIKNGDALRDALHKEARPFQQHLEANKRRLTAARQVQAATERWGPVLRWVHPGHTDTHRPSHVAANGANFRADVPPTSTGGFPGTLPNCECVAGAPNQGARMLS